jgi:hypothetical protein
MTIGEEVFQINSRAFAHFSIESRQDKKYSDLRTPTMDMLVGRVTVQNAFQVGRHVYVEMRSDWELHDVFVEYVHREILKFGSQVQPLLQKLERKFLPSITFESF